MGRRVITGFNIGQDLRAVPLKGEDVQPFEITSEAGTVLLEDLTLVMEFEPVWDLERDKFCLRIECARNKTDDLTNFVLATGQKLVDIRVKILNGVEGSDTYEFKSCKLLRYGLGRFKVDHEVRQCLYFEIGDLTRIIETPD